MAKRAWKKNKKLALTIERISSPYIMEAENKKYVFHSISQNRIAKLDFSLIF